MHGKSKVPGTYMGHIQIYGHIYYISIYTFIFSSYYHFPKHNPESRESSNLLEYIQRIGDHEKKGKFLLPLIWKNSLQILRTKVLYMFSVPKNSSLLMSIPIQ